MISSLNRPVCSLLLPQRHGLHDLSRISEAVPGTNLCGHRHTPEGARTAAATGVAAGSSSSGDGPPAAAAAARDEDGDDGGGVRGPDGGFLPGFRDADHKFEWSREQFRRWAEAVAGAAYDVSFATVGAPWGSTPDELVPFGGASQAAVFVRRDALVSTLLPPPVVGDESILSEGEEAAAEREQRPRDASAEGETAAARAAARELQQARGLAPPSPSSVWCSWR